MKYIDLFAGIGGFHYGIDHALSIRNGETKEGNGESKTFEQGVEPTQESDSSNRVQSDNLSSGATREVLCVYSNEWDKYANSVYRRHYGECDNRDIRTVEASEIPDFDLLCGGFPCQAFSVAGKRGGFDDTRGTLFFEVARILKEKQPRLLVLENVKGLLSHDSGRTFKVILATLTELGYDVQWQVLNSKNFGVPQNRERVYIVGHLRGTPRPEVFPITESNSTSLKQLNKPKFSSYRYFDKTGLSPTVKTMQGGNLQPKILVSKTIRAGGRKSPHGSKQNWDSYEVEGKIRRLTPTECMRLQGFPDNWCDFGAEGEAISDSQKYKMAGNAVTTNVVTAVMEKII